MMVEIQLQLKFQHLYCKALLLESCWAWAMDGALLQQRGFEPRVSVVLVQQRRSIQGVQEY